MPYDIFKRDDGYCVFKVDADKKPIGKTLGCHDSKEAAVKQIVAVEISESQTLKHVGVKGMRWGVRRKRSRKASSDYTSSRKLAKKKVSELSNEELKKLNNRLELERKFATMNPSTTGKGKKLVSKYLSNFGNQVANALIQKTATATAEALFEKVTG
jgi:hypothetical protein